MDKPLLWVGSSRSDLKAFPAVARRVAGFQLRRVQQGFEPDDWRPLPSLGTGAKEIRIHTGQEHRVIYVAKFAAGVYVLHAFEKKARKTSGRDLELARQRLRAVIRQRGPREPDKG